ncbi:MULTISPECIES: outer membrane protein assembly factor [unclassified Halanaerobium]|uniref:BamA/OMP85 family outer membrane protein n=1 Tax=unclassified Halanaerobium TaxID=2641197 RepID=UPI000DF17C7D|nr:MULTISPECIES: outer membrane protein assembly factor [unclassified Halanaerobium]RCW48247.1 Beta-barrel assembly machine subunit BamA [Halanaerobium sp. MA284_MarDTE_T2]RCW85674.1 Beta-barrel assembly machine subunit BamA [Halanaerobium sp. DL-01]
MRHNHYFKISMMAALVLALMVAITPSVAAQSPFDEIKKISVEGNENISEFEILSNVVTEVGDTLDQDQLRKDMRAVYDMGYFSDVNITFENYQNGLHVIFEVVENPILKEINFSGYADVYSEEKLKKMLDLKMGTVLNVKKMNENLKKIQEKAQDNGYILFRYTDVSISKEGILSIKMNPGYINEIKIEGNTKTDDRVILREMPVESGDIVNIKVIQKGYQKLYRLGYFDKINPELESVDRDKNTVNLIIKVSEGKTGRLNFGGGYSSKDGMLGFVNVSEKNLFGNGQNIGLRWQFGDNTTYSLNFYEPWLMNTKLSFGFSVYDENIESEDIDGNNYEENNKGGSITFGYPITEEWRTSIRYRLEDTETVWEEEDPLVNRVNESGSISSIRLAFNRDTTDHPFNPRHGGIDMLSTEYAGNFLGGDYDFTKYNLEMRRFFPGFKGRQAWALRMKAGLGYADSGEIPYSEKYKLGGSESLRGYENKSFTGDNMLLFNLEYRFPVSDNFSGVIFADAGNAWDDRDNIDLGDMFYGQGVGLRMNTPIGQLRLDYGWDEDGDGMPHFSIGNTF